MRRYVRLTLALLAAAQSAVLQAQEGCAELRTQYQALDELAAKPMPLVELRQVASEMASVRIDVVMLDALKWQDMTEAQRANLTNALEVIQYMGSRLGVGCDVSMTPTACADSLTTLAAHAVRLADPARFQAWRVEEALMKVRAAYDERAIRILADSVGLPCPASGPCRASLTSQLEALHSEAETVQLIDSLTDEASEGDARRPLFELLKGQLLEQMGELRCGEGPEAAPPVTVARVAPRDSAPPPPTPPARLVPVGGPVIEMDPNHDPESSPRDALWTTVQPGLMEFRGNGQYGSWTWSELPQSIGPEGALVTLTVTATTTRTGGWATGIQIRGNAKITKPDGTPIDLDLPLNLPPETSGQQSMTVLITPNDGYLGTDVVITVGAFYGASVRYYYKLVRTAGS